MSNIIPCIMLILKSFFFFLKFSMSHSDTIYNFVNWEWRDGSVVKSTSALPEDSSSVPGTHNDDLQPPIILAPGDLLTSFGFLRLAHK